MADRRYDVVLLGATGFTGLLTARYLAQHAQREGATFAIAGRNREKLDAIVSELTGTKPDVLVADVNDPASLAKVAESAKVVASTVGPYAVHGEPVVRACVEARTSYCDITGEPAFVDRILREHDARARERGVRLVSCCGFDSVPHDLGVYFTVKQLAADQPTRVRGYVRAKGGFSGGTFHSAVGAMATFRDHRAQRRSIRHAGATEGRTVKGLPMRIHYEPSLHAFGVPLPTIDPEIVLRSARLLPEYGSDFRYAHFAQVKNLSTIAVSAVSLSSMFVLAQARPTRNLLLKIKKQGDGPTEEQRAKARFTVTFLAESGDKKVRTEVSGGDPGYDETAKMLGESALCLARDALPSRAGALTPASAMGDALLARLTAAGISFRVLS